MITSTVQRWRGGRDTYRPAGEPIETSRYEVAAIAQDGPAKAFVVEHHYSGTYPAARFRFGLYRGPRLVGVAVFSQPCNDLSLRPLPGGAGPNVELGRFVLVDDVPANGETWFLARCFELLRASGIAGVVSFSDPMARHTSSGAVVFGGHVGTIYQAQNAVYLGQSRAANLRLLPDGRVLHARGVAKVRGKEQGWRYVVADLVERYGVAPPANDDNLRAWIDEALPRLTRSAKHPGNHKYVWALDRRVRRHLPASLEYPKLDAGGRAAA
jgi:hypothetical protein